MEQPGFGSLGITFRGNSGFSGSLIGLHRHGNLCYRDASVSPRTKLEVSAFPGEAQTSVCEQEEGLKSFPNEDQYSAVLQAEAQRNKAWLTDPGSGQ